MSDHGQAVALQYLEAFARQAEARAAVEAMLDGAAKILDSLKQNWRRSPSGSAAGQFFLDRPDGANWPTSEAISRMIEEWRRATVLVERTWQEVPTKMRAGLQKPPRD